MLTILGVKQFGCGALIRVSDRSNNSATLSKPDINFGDDGVSLNPGKNGYVRERNRPVLRECVGAVALGRGLNPSEVNQDGPRGRHPGEVGSELGYRTLTRNSE